MIMGKHVRLGVNVLASGRHDAAWKRLPEAATLSTDIDAFVHIAKIAERGRIDDQVQVYEAMQMLLPTAPTCGISHLQDDGRRLVVMAWFDAPETGPAVIAGLEAQGWSASAAPAAGYDTTTLTDGSASVEVHPIGLDNQESGIGQRWGGVDATMITVLLP